MSTISQAVPATAAETEHAEYYSKVHLIGRVFSTLMLFANVLPVILVWAFYGIFPDLEKVIPAVLVVYGILLPFFLTEGWMYYGVIGLAGTYMGWAGNVGNFRIPAASVAQDVMKTKPGSIESEVVGNIAISTSTYFSVAFILAGALLGNALIQNLPAWMQAAFAYALPCIFGALIAQFSMKGPKYALIIVPLAFLLILLFPTSASWQRVLGMLIIILPLAYFAFKRMGIFWVSQAQD